MADEERLIQTRASFATGTADRVEGQRSFRDFERNDIADELPGWPSAPPFSPHDVSHQMFWEGVKVLGFLALFAAGIAIAIAGNGVNPPLPDVGTDSRGRVQEPENEVDDFPVMWADPHTLARTAPWQLDPARRPKGYRTDVVITDRRLIVLGGTGSLELIDGDVLWKFPAT